MSYEIVWIRIYTMASWGKSSAFGVLLGAYLAGLAGGALLARRFCRDDHKREVRALALFVLGANLLGYLIVPAMAELVRFAWYIWALPLVALAAALLGTTFPLIAHFGVPPDERVGARVSYLYGANIVGSTVGSLLTGIVLLDHFSLRTISDMLVTAGVIVAIGVSRLDSDRRSRARVMTVGVAAVCVIGFFSSNLFDGFYEKLQFKGRVHVGHAVRADRREQERGRDGDRGRPRVRRRRVRRDLQHRPGRGPQRRFPGVRAARVPPRAAGDPRDRARVRRVDAGNREPPDRRAHRRGRDQPRLPQGHRALARGQRPAQGPARRDRRRRRPPLDAAQRGPVRLDHPEHDLSLPCPRDQSAQPRVLRAVPQAPQARRDHPVQHHQVGGCAEDGESPSFRTRG